MRTGSPLKRRISEDRNLVHLGRWPRVRKGYQGGWGRGPRLHFTCPMPRWRQAGLVHSVGAAPASKRTGAGLTARGIMRPEACGGGTVGGEGRVGAAPASKRTGAGLTARGVV